MILADERIFLPHSSVFDWRRSFQHRPHVKSYFQAQRGADIRLGELFRQGQLFLPLHGGDRFRFGIFFPEQIQAVLDAAHCGKIIVRHSLVVGASVDEDGVEAFVTEESIRTASDLESRPRFSR